MASLGRFISNFGEKVLPFFKIMKRSGTFKWTPKVDMAFEDLKKYLASVPIMVAPRHREPLKLYLSATLQTVSAVLVTEREEPTLPRRRLPHQVLTLMTKKTSHQAPSRLTRPPLPRGSH